MIRPGLAERLNKISFAICSCGACNSSGYLCSNCIDRTLGTAGLSKDKYHNRLKEKLSRNNSSFDPAGTSEVACEMRKIIKEEEDKIMSEKTKGLYQKYEVKKLTNPDKKIDCMVLEFDDPLAREGIKAFAAAVLDAGYVQLHQDIMKKVAVYEQLI